MGQGVAVFVTVCGDCTVTDATGRPILVRTRQVQVALACLALAGRPVSRDELAEALWGEGVSAHWQGAVRSIVAKLRLALTDAGHPATVVRSEGAMVWLDVPDVVTTDVGAAEALVAETASRLADDPASAVDLAARACALTAGPFLSHADTPWAQRQRAEIDALAGRAARLHVESLLAAGRAAEAAETARQRVADHPLDEAVHHLLVAALLADGQRAAAVRAHAELADVLTTELGIAPDRQTTALLAPLRPTSARARPAGDDLGADGRFVGRAQESTTLIEAWEAVVATSAPRVVLAEGPAGIGKTRLVQQVAARVERGGWIVSWARSVPNDGRAYGAIGDLVEDAFARDPDLVPRLGRRAEGLGWLLPHLAEGDARPPDDEGVARTQLFSSVAALLAVLAREPALVVLDDLHWASDDTLALLTAVVEGSRLPLLVVGCVRSSPDGLPSALAELARRTPMERVVLDAMSAGEITELVVGPSPHDPDDLALGAAVHARTGGLPFFAAELGRSARRAGVPIDAAAVPPVVRDWIAQRVRGLAPALRAVLELASVVGTDVDLGVLRRAFDGPVDDCDQAVDDLVAHGLLVDASGGAVSFGHAIIREVVYDGLGPARRATSHHGIAEALASSPPAAGRHAELAHHYRHAGPDSGSHLWIHATEGGREAMAIGAWDQAEVLFRTALAAAAGPAARARALVGLGQATLRRSAYDEARQTLLEAIELAATNDLPFELAEATLAVVGRAGRGAAVDRPRQAALLRDALVALVATDPTREQRRREILLSHLERELAIALLLTGAVAERVALLERSLARARSLTPPDLPALAACLLAQRFGDASTIGARRRLADTEEVLRLPPAQLPHELQVLTRVYRHADLVQLGDRSGASETLVDAEGYVEEYPDPYWRWAVATWRVVEAIVGGRLDDAEAIAVGAAQLLPGVPEAVACLGVNIVDIRLYQRRAGEVLDLLAAAASANPQIPCYRAVLALCASEAGDEPLAAKAYNWFAASGFKDLPPDTNQFLGRAVLAHVAADLGDRRGGALLEDLLTPHVGETVVLDCYGGGGATWGPVSHALARLAALAGRHDDAEALFARATTEAGDAPLVLERIDLDRR